MNNMIVDLQRDILENKDLLTILRKAFLISNELGLTDFNNWIKLELNGYSSKDSIPEYRLIHTDLKCHTSQYTINGSYDNPNTYICNTPDFILDLCDVYLPDSIPTLLNICNHQNNDNMIIIKFDNKIEDLIRETLLKQTSVSNNTDILEIYRVCSRNQIENIFDFVKNTILSWTSELKYKDIFGNDFNFTENEKYTAQNINFNIFNVDNSSNINNNISIDMFSFKNKINNDLNEIESILDNNNVENVIHKNISSNISMLKKELSFENLDMKKIEDVSEKIYDLIKEITKSLIVDLLKPHILHILYLISQFINF